MNQPASGAAPGRLRKWLRICGGFLLIAGGLVLSIPGVPGPGFVLVFVGLVMLSEYYHWARRLLAWARQKWDRLRRK
jgi:uncharacterized protein (TIGR02611 family)